MGHRYVVYVGSGRHKNAKKTVRSVSPGRKVRWSDELDSLLLLNSISSHSKRVFWQHDLGKWNLVKVEITSGTIVTHAVCVWVNGIGVAIYHVVHRRYLCQTRKCFKLMHLPRSEARSTAWSLSMTWLEASSFYESQDQKNSLVYIHSQTEVVNSNLNIRVQTFKSCFKNLSAWERSSLHDQFL